MRVGLVFGGRSVEHQVSVRSARTVGAALEQAGHEVLPLPIGPDGGWLAPELGRRALVGEIESLPAAEVAVRATLSRLVEAEVDVIFPLVHGTFGEDGTLQGLCEMADLPYVGADVTASAVAMDKLLAKKILAAAGIPVVDYESVSRLEFAADAEKVLARVGRLGPPPLFVKPSVGGSSVGVVKVESADRLGSSIAQALALDDNALVELSIEGRELECAVLGYPEVAASVLGEIRPGHEFYDYADKYLEDGAEILCPAELDDQLAARIRAAAAAAFAAIGGTGMARVDFLLAGERFWINEINTLPGFTSISMYPMLWEASGVAPVELVDRLVRAALARHADRRALDQRIRAWLAELAE